MEEVPQHAVFSFQDVQFSSNFDSGNLSKAEQVEDQYFHLWTGPDAQGTVYENSCRTWFYFQVLAKDPKTLKFTIKNLNAQSRLYKDEMKPLFSFDQQTWLAIPSAIDFATISGNFELTWSFDVPIEGVYFAFTYPWSFSQHLGLIDQVQKICEENSIFFYSENCVNSLEGRPCHVLTVSSFTGLDEKREKKIQFLFSDGKPRCQKFNGKKVVFVSARVHPGEVPSSHVLNGFLKFIVSQDQRAVALRELFVFKVIPILNPDGVFRGFYRTDTRGANLNRFYSSPVLSEHPTIYAAKELFTYYHSLYQVYVYVDLHAHAARKGCFIYGNYMDFKDQIETCLFPKLMALNCANFDLQGCNFSEANMRAKDKRDGLSKEGSGRVSFFKQLNVQNCYTLECNYNTGKVINTLVGPEDDVTDRSSEIYKSGPPKYTISIFEDVGRAIAVSTLDLAGKNPISRFSSLQDLKLEVASYVSSLIPFRFDPAIKKACKNWQDLENYFTEKNKEEIKKPPRPDKRPLACRNKSDGKPIGALSKDNFVVMVKEEGHSAGIRARDRGGSRSASKEKKEGNVVRGKEIVFLPQPKESSSQRGRSMNRRVARTIITQSNSLNPRRVELV